jgi:hypothetical protein
VSVPLRGPRCRYCTPRRCGHTSRCRASRTSSRVPSSTYAVRSWPLRRSAKDSRLALKSAVPRTRRRRTSELRWRPRAASRRRPRTAPEIVSPRGDQPDTKAVSAPAARSQPRISRVFMIRPCLLQCRPMEIRRASAESYRDWDGEGTDRVTVGGHAPPTPRANSSGGASGLFPREHCRKPRRRARGCRPGSRRSSPASAAAANAPYAFTEHRGSRW